VFSRSFHKEKKILTELANADFKHVPVQINDSILADAEVSME
jgi:hypothetical protein